jgi:hypothetical protein
MKELIIDAAVVAAIFAVVNNNLAAFSTWARQALAKFVGWSEQEAALGLADIEALFRKHAVAPALAPASPVTVNVTTAPAAPVVPVAAPAPTNQVPVPDGLTADQFLHLVLAAGGAASMLGNPALHAALVASSGLWWADLGQYFREELLIQTAGDQALADVRAAFEALDAASHVPMLSVNPEVQTAALLAVKNGIAPEPAGA